MPKKEKFVPKVPPHHLYCPICGEKAEYSEMLDSGEDCREVIIHKFCDKCGATWVVKYSLKPKAITNIKVNYEYEDIPL